MTNPNKISFLQQYMHLPYLTSCTQKEADKIKDVYIDLIKDGISNSELKNIPIDLIYTITVQQLFGMIQYFSMKPDKYQDPEFRNLAFNIFYNTINLHYA